jgi:triosephosphate isomerase
VVAAVRRPLVVANWKMNLRRREATALCAELRRGLDPAGAEVVVCPSHPLLPAVATALAGAAAAVGGQDLHPEPAGAHTGDVAGGQLVDAGCAWVIVGHSERRLGHGESDALVAAKARAALAAGLRPIVCVGETRDERRSGRTFEVLERMLEPLPPAPELVLAYEPVWAIGTGDSATTETAAEAHGYLRDRIRRRAGEDAAAALRILYGGSVTPDNAAALAAAGDIDGFLVGGASLDPSRFLAILRVFAPLSGAPRGTS